MRIHFVRVVSRTKVRGFSRRYSSHTHCYVYKDDVLKGDLLTNSYGGFTKCVERLKKQYGEGHQYTVDKKGYSFNKNY